MAQKIVRRAVRPVNRTGNVLAGEFGESFNMFSYENPNKTIETGTINDLNSNTKNAETGTITADKSSDVKHNSDNKNSKSGTINEIGDNAQNAETGTITADESSNVKHNSDNKNSKSGTINEIGDNTQNAETSTITTDESSNVKHNSDSENSKSGTINEIGDNTQNAETSTIATDESSNAKHNSDNKNSKSGTINEIGDNAQNAETGTKKDGFLRTPDILCEQFLDADLEISEAVLFIFISYKLLNSNENELAITYDDITSETGLNRNLISSAKEAFRSKYEQERPGKFEQEVIISSVITKGERNIATIYSRSSHWQKGVSYPFFGIPRYAYPLIWRLRSAIDIKTSMLTLFYYNRGFIPDTPLILSIPLKAIEWKCAQNTLRATIKKKSFFYQHEKHKQGQYLLYLKDEGSTTKWKKSQKVVPLNAESSTIKTQQVVPSTAESSTIKQEKWYHNKNDFPNENPPSENTAIISLESLLESLYNEVAASSKRKLPTESQFKRELKSFKELLKIGLDQELILTLMKDLIEHGDRNGDVCSLPATYLSSGMYDHIQQRIEKNQPSGKLTNPKVVNHIKAHLSTVHEIRWFAESINVTFSEEKYRVYDDAIRALEAEIDYLAKKNNKENIPFFDSLKLNYMKHMDYLVKAYKEFDAKGQLTPRDLEEYVRMKEVHASQCQHQ